MQLSVKHIPNAMRRPAMVLCIMMIATISMAAVAGASEQQQIVDKARMTMEAFNSDPDMGPAVRSMGEDAKAVFIIPQFMRGAVVFGGAGGSGVLLVRDEKTGTWSEPAFYTMGNVSFGLQVGADVSEIVLIVRNQKGLEEFYRSDFKLGADASIAAGPVGQGASVKGITGDIIAYARKKGAFAGVSVDGGIIKVSDDSNKAYYGKPVRPTDIVVKRSVSNPQSADLRNTVAKIMK